VNKWISVLVILCFIPSGRSAAQHVRDEGLAHTLGPEWKPTYQIYEMGNYNLLQFIRNGDTPKDWKEMVTIQGFTETTKHTPEETYSKLQAESEKKCPGALRWKVISKDETSILYEWHSDACGASPVENNIGRVILGKYSWYILQYSAKVAELSPEARAQWIKTFSDATFDSVTSSFDPQWMSVNVDEVVPFPMDKVMAALKPAMESQNCNVSSSTTERIECKRPRDYHSGGRGSSGGESVTALLEAKGEQTEVRITTGLGFYGRLVKRNYSTPVYEEMMRNLQKTQP
jgi:hypothetical protein